MVHTHTHKCGRLIFKIIQRLYTRSCTFYIFTCTHTHTHRFVNSKLQCNFCIQKLIGVRPKMRLSGVPQRTQALYVHTPTYLSNSVRTNGSSQPHWLTAAEFAQRSRYIARLHCVDTVALPLSSEQL